MFIIKMLQTRHFPGDRSNASLCLVSSWLLLLFIACSWAVAQTESPTSLVRLADDVSYQATWQGVSGRTYFTQYSHDLINWTYSPGIKRGRNSPMTQGFEPEGAPRFFVRRVETDAPAQDPDTADFDGDGIANIVEMQRGLDPFIANAIKEGKVDHDRETVHLKLLTSQLSNQQLNHGQILANAPVGHATVALSGGATGTVASRIVTWGGGRPGSYRGFLGPALPSAPGRAAIATLVTDGQGDMNSFVGFTTNGSLSGLNGAQSMAMILQRSAYNSYNRLVTNAGSGYLWSEMNHVISVNSPLQAKIRRESDGFSSWIRGGIFASTGAVIGSAVWFPVSRWKSVTPTASQQAGIYNSWVGPTQNSEFCDVENPAVDATSALLDYERNKLGLHVPSLLLLPGGEMLAAWQNATTHESADCVIRMARRNSRGVWGPVSTVLAAGVDGAVNQGPTLHKAGNQIWLTYQSTTNGIYTARKRILTTNGDMFSLSPPVTLFNEALIINHALTLPGGRIIACWHTHSSEWKNRISYSDDHGLTWKVTSMPEFPWKAGEGFAIIEADGSLASYWRTDQRAIYRSTSNDHGVTWTALSPTAIPCANMPTQGLLGSRLSGFKRPSDGKVVVVGSDSTTQREKLTAWLIENGVIVGTQSLFPWDVPDGSAEGVHYPDVVVHPDDSMTVIFARWLGGGLGSAELHSAINTFKIEADFR